MRTPTSRVVAIGFGIFLSSCTSAPDTPDVGVASFGLDATEQSVADVGVVDAGVADSSRDAPSFDAVLGPPRPYWRNPTPPVCAQRLDPPRWRVTTDPGPVGTVRWVRSLGEHDFQNWARALGTPPLRWRNVAPSLTGDGIAAWIFVARLEDENRMIGLNHADGSWGNAVPVDPTNYPRMWIPNVYVLGQGGGGRRMFPLAPPDYYPLNPPSDNSVWTVDPAVMFGPDISFGGVGSTSGQPMPAWSPVSGDMVTFGHRSDGAFSGVGVGCVEGNRWFTEIPGIHIPSTVNYVRPDGDVIVTSIGHIWILDGETGEPLRSADIDVPVPRLVAAYQPGCGLLVQDEVDAELAWYWVNDDTMARGPALRLPPDRPTSSGAWSGTSDCGLVASAGRGNLVRLNADGSVRFNTPIPAGFIATAAPPVALADEGILVMTDPPGWIRFNSMGEITSTVALDTSNVGFRTTSDSVLAPDGTMYFMTESGGEIRFGAASTGAIPGPYLWPNSGLNWARTNSILPD